MSRRAQDKLGSPTVFGKRVDKVCTFSEVGARMTVVWIIWSRHFP